MKAILKVLTLTLYIIEDIILFPVDLVVALIGKIEFRNNIEKCIDLWANYLWLVRGWYFRLNGIGKIDERCISEQIDD